VLESVSMASIAFHPGAMEDYEEAVRYYFARNDRAAARFEEAVERGLRAISETPDSWPMCDDRNHFHILKKFPFSIVYRVIEQETIVVVAIAHAKRRHEYWKERS
jgi:plasmid stabilization system protein ParE